MNSEPDFWDRPWSSAYVTTLLGPLRGITAEHVERRHAGLLAALPETAWLRRHRVADPAPIAVAVTGDLVGRALALADRPWAGAPLRVLVQGDRVAVLHSHGVGDGFVSRHLVRDLLAPEEAPYTLPGLRRPSQRSIVGQAAGRWVRSPGALLAAVRGASDRRSPAVAAAVAAPPPDTEPVLLSRCLDQAGVARVRAARDGARPDATVSTLLLGAVVAELARRDVGLQRVGVSTNLRRYLARADSAGGNLVSTLRFDAGDTSPDALAQHLHRALASGQPLLQFLLTNARYQLAAARGRTGSTAGPEPVPSLGWSDRGHIDGWDVLPWAGGPRLVATGLAPVWGRRIGIHLSRVDGELHLSCLINARAFDPGVVEAALDAALAELATPPPDRGGIVA